MLGYIRDGFRSGLALLAQVAEPFLDVQRVQPWRCTARARRWLAVVRDPSQRFGDEHPVMVRQWLAPFDALGQFLRLGLFLVVLRAL